MKDQRVVHHDRLKDTARKSSVKMTGELREFLELGRKYPLNGGER